MKWSVLSSPPGIKITALSGLDPSGTLTLLCVNVVGTCAPPLTLPCINVAIT